MPIPETAPRTAQPTVTPSLTDHYKVLNRQLQAALLHARRAERRRETEPCGGDSAMD